MKLTPFPIHHFRCTFFKQILLYCYANVNPQVMAYNKSVSSKIMACQWIVVKALIKTTMTQFTDGYMHRHYLKKNVDLFIGAYTSHQGWRLLSQFPRFRYFPIFSALSNHTLAIEYHVYIWQVSPQLSCGDTCQIWMWFEESNMYFCHVENFAYGEINERSFSNPHPRPQWVDNREQLFDFILSASRFSHLCYIMVQSSE